MTSQKEKLCNDITFGFKCCVAGATGLVLIPTLFYWIIKKVFNLLYNEAPTNFIFQYLPILAKPMIIVLTFACYVAFLAAMYDTISSMRQLHHLEVIE